MRFKFSKTFFIGGLILLASLALANGQASAAAVQLAWTDNSDNESGFNVERKLGTGGSFAVITTVAANATTHSDENLADGTTYCYRVNAYNDAGASAYTADACATTPVKTYSVTLVSGVGGKVTSSPSGIDCGTACVANFTGGATVSLQAVAASGYAFTGWSGDSDCLDGSLTMNANKSCAANFGAVATGYLLTASSVGVINSLGTGSGKVVSSPAGIDCGADCSETFSSGTVVALEAVPASGSTFVGWSGDSDCSDGSVTMNADKACTASFKIIGYSLSVAKAGSGSGKITSDVSGIDCGTVCSAEFAKGTVVVLTPTPATGSHFAGWSGDQDCTDGSVTLDGNKSCTANFTAQSLVNVGIFRPATGAWYLIANPTGQWQGCETDLCGGPFGSASDLPLAGDWNGSGSLTLGLYDTKQKLWKLDVNGDLTWDNCTGDDCFDFALDSDSNNAETPLTGKWNGSAKSLPGVYKIAAESTSKGKGGPTGKSAGYWYLDGNGNGKWDGCTVDLCYGPFGQEGDIPVVGDWMGTGMASVGVFKPENGTWLLDLNRDGKVNNCNQDRCFGPFGAPGDIPIVGDWDNSGSSKIGVFRPNTGEWFLDVNGNGKWDGPNVDRYISGFGQPGDLPFAGKW